MITPGDLPWQVSVRTLLVMQSEIARVLNALPIPETTAAVLEVLGRALDSPVVTAWGVTRREPRLRYLSGWSKPEDPQEPQAKAFLQTYGREDLAAGEGLPGQAWQSGRIRWITDPSTRPDWPRASHWSAAGLVAGVSFPTIGPDGIRGAIEFYSRVSGAPGDDLLTALDVLGRHIGQWTERLHVEDDRRARQARHTAILSSALDGIITIDADGRVLEFNEAAQQMFGFSQEDALGSELADLVVPTHLRESHREGLARYVATGQETILGQRIETVGARADGAEFPLELTITRLPVRGTPVFTGHLRDITERVSAARELRASRVRIVESADAERRRIQRNLHDGAQQRLTALAIAIGQVRQRLAHDPTEAGALLEESEYELAAAIRELRDLSHGMHPEVLHDLGLAAAIRDLLRRCPLESTADLTLPDRLPEMIEAGAYYTVAEALTNAVRHAHATTVRVAVRDAGERLMITVGDDGRGGADLTVGTGLRGLGDRVAALGGTLTIDSPRGKGTTLTASLPTR